MHGEFINQKLIRTSFDIIKFDDEWFSIEVRETLGSTTYLSKIDQFTTLMEVLSKYMSKYIKKDMEYDDMKHDVKQLLHSISREFEKYPKNKLSNLLKDLSKYK